MKYPNSNIDFDPSPIWFLGRLNICDDDDLAEELLSYDPNNKEHRDIIIRNYIIKKMTMFTYRHNFLLVKELEKSIKNPEYDFGKKIDEITDDYCCLAWDETEIDTPRSFMERVYEIAKEEWRDDLEKASLEDQSTW